MGCKVVGWGKALPKTLVKNDDLAALVDTSDQWIVERTGIHERRIAIEETGTDLASAAGAQALKRAGLSPNDIDLIICMTLTPDVLIPAEACLIKTRLGLTRAVAFDLNSACTGCIYGMEVASTMIEASQACAMGTAKGIHRGNPMKRALIVGVERLSRIVDWTDRATCVLFGDGAGAVVLEWQDDAPGILSSFLENTDDTELTLACDAVYNLSTFPFGTITGDSGTDILRVPEGCGAPEGYRPFISMQGQKVFKWASTTMAQAVQEVCNRAGLAMESISCIVPHQANERIIRFASKKLGIPLERFQVSIGNVGNTSASSVLMALTDGYESGRINPGDKVVLVGFGGGLTAGAILFEA